jgi:hypothetical protein
MIVLVFTVGNLILSTTGSYVMTKKLRVLELNGQAIAGVAKSPGFRRIQYFQEPEAVRRDAPVRAHSFTSEMRTSNAFPKIDGNNVLMQEDLGWPVPLVSCYWTLQVSEGGTSLGTVSQIPIFDARQRLMSDGLSSIPLDFRMSGLLALGLLWFCTLPVSVFLVQRLSQR